jgi:hypothetical protein
VRSTLRLCAAIAALVAAPYAQAASYSRQQLAAPEFETNLGLPDPSLSIADTKNVYYATNFTTPFLYFGGPVAGFYIEVDGNMSTGVMAWSWMNSVPGLQSATRIAPAWDDWTFESGPADRGVYVNWLDSAGNTNAVDPEKFVVTWYGCRHYHDTTASGTAAFQVVLHKDGRIQFNYLPYTSQYVPTATIGISASDPATAWAWDVASTDLGSFLADPWGLNGPRTIVFTPVPPDTQPPVTVATVDGVPGNAGWFLSSVLVHLSATDDTAVASTEYSLDGGTTWVTYAGSLVVSSEGATVVQFRSTDTAGNVEAPQQLALLIDQTSPAVSITTPANGAVYPLCSVLTADWSAADAVSGVAGASATLPVGAAIPTTAAGTFTFTATATDVAGHTTAVTSTYSVVARNRGQRCR